MNAAPTMDPEGSLETDNVDAEPADTLNDELTAEVRIPLVAVSVYPEPALSMRRSVNVAMPFSAETVAVPWRVAPATPVPEVMLRETALLAEDIALPSRSLTTTSGCVAKLLPAVGPAG